MEIFISWSGEYGEELSKAIKRAIGKIQDNLGNKAFSVFVSSESIELGLKWRNELHEALHKADRGLIIVTQDIIHSDWISHEAATLTNKHEHLWFLLADSPSALLPEPLREYQFAALSNESLAKVITKLCLENGLVAPPSPDLLESLYEEVQRIRSKYHYVTSVESRWRNKLEKNLLIKKQEDSPFDLKEVINTTQSRAVLIAQNHHFMVDDENKEDNETFWPVIASALNRGVKIDIVGMHPDVNPPKLETAESGIGDAMSVWAHYMGAAHFFDHVKSTWESLERWHGFYEEMKSNDCTGELRIFGAYFTPITINAVDPASESGFLVISPRPSNETSTSRPQFIVYKKSSPDTFDYYWQTIKNSYSNASWKKMFA